MLRKDTVIAALVLVLVVGCHWMQQQANAPTPNPISDAGSGVAGVVAHTESAQRHVQNATPHSDSEGKVLLQAASEEHKEVLADAAETKAALVEASRAVTSLEGRLDNEQQRYAHLVGQWYVTWGRRIERALWAIGIGWLVCGVASIVLGMGNPLSLTWRVGKEITRLLPAMNLFSWVRDWILQRQQSGSGSLPLQPGQVTR